MSSTIDQVRPQVEQPLHPPRCHSRLAARVSAMSGRLQQSWEERIMRCSSRVSGTPITARRSMAVGGGSEISNILVVHTYTVVVHGA